MKKNIVSIVASLIVIIFCGSLFFVTYQKGVTFLYAGEVADQSNFFGSYASLFGALITVFVALFSIQKWWDRAEFHELKEKLEQMQKENKNFKDEVTKKVTDELLPKMICDYVKNHTGEVVQPLKDMMVDDYGLNACFLHIEFLETLYNSQSRYLEGERECVFARGVFNEVVQKIRNYPLEKNIDIFEKAIDLLKSLTEKLMSKDFITDSENEFYENLEYLYHLFLEIKFDPNAINALSGHEDDFKGLGENIQKLYAVYISRPEEKKEHENLEECSENDGLSDKGKKK